VLVLARAVLSDVDEVVEIVNRAYSPAPDASGWAGERSFQPGERTEAREVADLINRPAAAVVVGRRDGRMISCCYVARRNSTTAYLGLFAVDPDQQSDGAGRQTMQYGEAFARTEFNATRMLIEVMEHHEPLRQWYSRIGYRTTGVRSPFPESVNQQSVFLIEMEKTL
jgi:GNAT superfamily N-acetyltransferase